jgi:hypothetical protein
MLNRIDGPFPLYKSCSCTLATVASYHYPGSMQTRRYRIMDPLQLRLTNILMAADWDSDEDESFFHEIDRIREEAVSEFTFERLRSFYVADPHIYLPIKYRLTEAKALFLSMLMRLWYFLSLLPNYV